MLEPWQILYVLIAFVGLMIGWLFDPKFGLIFIWALVIAIEAIDYRRSRRATRPST
jgi:hypothetical protein